MHAGKYQQGSREPPLGSQEGKDGQGQSKTKVVPEDMMVLFPPVNRIFPAPGGKVSHDSQTIEIRRYA
jgi:hypothetical protein